MSYKNPYSIAYEVEQALDGGSYNVHAHGDLGAHFNSTYRVDLPAYTTMFYHPSQHESFTELKYDKLLIDYDSGLKEIRDIVRGAPMEAYIPESVVAADGVGKSALVEVLPKKSIVDEILKAQAEVLGRTFVKVTEIRDEIQIQRRIKRVEIIRE